MAEKEVRAEVVEDDKQVVLAKPRAVSKRARPAGTVAVNPAALMMAAVRGKVPPETMREIMAVRRELVEEQAKREYYDALTAFQRDLEPIIKTKKVRNKQEYLDEHPEAEETRFRYAPLEVIAKKIQQGCDAHGFSYDFDSDAIAEHMMPVHCLIHHVGGYSTRHTFYSPVLFEDGKKLGQSAAQVVAGALTFGKRSSLVEGFGITSADPDPEALEGENAKKAEGMATDPRTTGEAQSSKRESAGTKESLGEVFQSVNELIEKKCVGKAAESFKATARKHYAAERKDLLAALRTSLRLMKQGASK